MSTRRAAANLAAAFLSGDWSPEGLRGRGELAVGRGERWLPSFVQRVLTAFPSPPARQPADALTAFIEADTRFNRAWERARDKGRPLLRQLFSVSPSMCPAAGAPSSWDLPTLPTPDALAGWLGLTLAELEWFADCHGHEARVRPGPLRHYAYAWAAKRAGKWRLLEMPKARLKAVQRRLLAELLDRVPPHDAAHGYRRGRSVATFAAPHCRRRIVLRFDLRHFFPSVRAARVHALFATAGYPRDVARLLTGLCTNAVPADVWDTFPAGAGAAPGWEDRRRYASPHLPQGAPTSPALANLCALGLDRRLDGLARKLGASYTRYADDLAFSGGEELERAARRFQVQVCRVALEEGFEVHTRKSRFMRRAVRQQLAGVVVNERLNIRREEYDRLKAILHNCARHGPESQNRDGHPDFRACLLGHIAHVAMLHPERGRRLRELFARVRWVTA